LYRGLDFIHLHQAALCAPIVVSHALSFFYISPCCSFVVVTDSIGEGSFDGVKGIDLESVVPMGGPPLDYSPEACPPEFAEEYLAGRGLDFRVDYHYDIWSLGMLLYELSTGKTYFDGKSPAQITKILRAPSFEPDVSSVPDGRLRDLIKQCLVLNPDKRPGITQILLHPYFLTTGIGPISL
jgi:serine/threonine protein kinase